MGIPSVILRSQFTVPTAKSFTNYMNYITRKEAIIDNRKSELSLDDRKELDLINKSISEYDMKYSISKLEMKSDNLKDPKESEALELLNSKQLFENQSLSYEKYLSYMSRYYAIENKKNKTELEKLEQRVVRKKISETTNLLKPDKVNNKTYSGVFTKESNELNSEQFNEATEIVKKAQKNGSVFFQDVISFDNDFLEKENILNSKTGQLDEKRLRNASIKMMDKMFDSEDINSGFWIASIHRNTKHIHIHYASVETVNTRKTVKIEKEDKILYEPKGKRKQKTIDEMKSTFSNSLVDRTAQLSRISDLRNSLVQDIKEKYQVTNKKEATQINLIKGIYELLPANKKNWNYKNISENNPKAKEKIDLLTNSLMFDNNKYQEYIVKVKEESNYRKELFGETSREDKDYFENKKADINKRLGNSLLKEMKNQSNKSVLAKSLPSESFGLYQIKQSRDIVEGRSTEYPKVDQKLDTKDNNFGKEKENENYKINNYQNKNYTKPFVNKINLYQFKKALNDDYDKYRAENDYEQLKKRIAMEQERNTL